MIGNVEYNLLSMETHLFDSLVFLSFFVQAPREPVQLLRTFQFLFFEIHKLLLDNFLLLCKQIMSILNYSVCCITYLVFTL